MIAIAIAIGECDTEERQEANLGLPRSHPLSRAGPEGRRQPRVPVDPLFDPAHGRHLHAEPVPWVVRTAASLCDSLDANNRRMFDF